MHWQWTELLELLHHFPHAIHDLAHREDKQIVQAGLPGLVMHPPGVANPIPAGVLEKDIDPAIDRSRQNLGLLVKEYLATLPQYQAHTPESQALLEHWRKILQEQPERLSQAKLESWKHEHAGHFWRDRLNRYTAYVGTGPEHFPNPLDDWERSAGSVPPPQFTLGAMKTKQWQDMVIRQRLHDLDQANMARYR